MRDHELFAALVARGFKKEHQGGGTHAFVKGNIVVSGADADMPSEHWYCVTVYENWPESSDGVLWTVTDRSGDFEFVDEAPRAIWADILIAEEMAG
jgi:hypothetical protein